MSAEDLLLKTRVDGAGYFAGTTAATASPTAATAVAQAPSAFAWLGSSKQKIPSEPLKPGEQFRFHFNAGKCISCECCVVACNEQNGNPATVQWRKVGEVEGGSFPNTKRYSLSMGCNHCLDPACLTGCPTDAYFKDLTTGIVRHKDDACIGCQYCMWNCPYGVPQFNEERHIVTKCDMCYGRLGLGSEPACVAACPQDAILIEKVNVEEWKANHAQADAPGMPDSGDTLSTTRITFPKDFPSDLQSVDEYRLEPEHPHTPLVFMTVLTQLSVGAFFSNWLIEIFSLRASAALAWFRSFMGAGASAALFVGFLALGVSVLHLGRPMYAYKALKMWRRSWLSREVLLFGIFSVLSTIYAGLWLEELFLGKLGLAAWVRAGLGLGVVASGIGGIVCSGYIYMVPARPSWNSIRTPLRFFLTGLILGPLFTTAVFSVWQLAVAKGADWASCRVSLSLWLGIAFVASAFQLGLLLTSLFGLFSQDMPELRGTAILLTRRFKMTFVARLATAAIGGMLIPTLMLALWISKSSVSSHDLLLLTAASGIAVLAVLASELLGRYLFFVTVVPKNIAGTFFRQ